MNKCRTLATHETSTETPSKYELIGSLPPSALITAAAAATRTTAARLGWAVFNATAAQSG
ncbi:MAG: hypothetical protein EXR77_16405 [Myxococcales bacterium]|nr:hypothetical protein [Myxococcales bacterium]